MNKIYTEDDLCLLFEKIQIDIENLIVERLIEHGFNDANAISVCDNGVYVLDKALSDMKLHAKRFILNDNK